MLVGKRADDRFDLIASHFTWNTSKCKFFASFVACVCVSKEEDGPVQIEHVSINNYLQSVHVSFGWIYARFNLFSPLLIGRFIISFQKPVCSGRRTGPDLYNGFHFNRLRQRNPGPSGLFLQNQLIPPTSFHLTQPKKKQWKELKAWYLIMSIPCKPRCDFLQCDLFTWGKWNPR